MEDLVHQKQKIDINFSKAKAKFCLTLDCNSDNNYLFANEKNSVNLKLVMKVITFHLIFV